MTKPFGLRELLARIRAVLRRRETGRITARQEAKQGRCRFGGWQLDRRARRLTNPLEPDDQRNQRAEGRCRHREPGLYRAGKKTVHRQIPPLPKRQTPPPGRDRLSASPSWSDRKWAVPSPRRTQSIVTGSASRSRRARSDLRFHELPRENV